jgi:type II secretion system protein H
MYINSERGFTLIEMLVVIAIVALIAAFALPQFSGAQAKAAMTSTAHRLAAGLRSTRSLAMAARPFRSVLAGYCAWALSRRHGHGAACR